MGFLGLCPDKSDQRGLVRSGAEKTAPANLRAKIFRFARNR